MPRIHLPVFTERSAISSKTGSGASVMSAGVLGERPAGESGPAVDHHAAAAADSGAADEVEGERRVEPLADLVEREEKCHSGRFLELEGLGVRHAGRVARIMAQHVET
jgi:hypothetical protein